MGRQCAWRGEIRVAVDRAVAKKLCIGESRNHLPDSLLFQDSQSRLESDDVPQVAVAIFAAQLDNRPRSSACSRICQADRLERSKAKRIRSAFRCDFDRPA